MALATFLLGATSGEAQTNERLFEGLNFSFVTPGARAVGMGMTFVGLADDATAAASNPAGLSNLRHLEISLEFLGLYAGQRYLVSNQLQGAPCSAPCDVFKTFGHTSWALPSFASIAMPIGDFTVAGFLNSQQSFRRTFDLEPRFVAPASIPLGTFAPAGQTGESGTIDVSVRNYGVGGAWAAQPWLSVGASFVVSHLELESEGLNIEDGALRSRTHTSASVFRPSVFAGVLARPSRRAAVGLGFYRGTTFPMRTEIAGTFGNAANAVPADRCLNQSFRNPSRVCEPQPPLETEYVVPSRVAIGGSYRVSNAVTVVGEVAHVRYSQLVTSRFQIVDFRFSRSISRDNFFYDDVNEYHAGLEYRWMAGGHLLAVRAGAFTDPDHSLRFTATDLSSASAVENFVFNTNRPSGTRIGATMGMGLTFGNRLQADAAVSLAPGARRFAVSVVRRFP